MSEHSVNVIEIAEVLPHPNADRLELVPVGGWQAVVKKGDFKPGDRAVYIEPDYTVPTSRAEFAFLAKEGRERHRLKAVRLRGQLSFGLLIPVPDDVASAPVGSDVMDQLGIMRWEPEQKVSTGGDRLPEDEAPKTYAPVFDIESYQRFPDVIQNGEHVIVTEKVHGANARYVFAGGTFYAGSRNHWLREGDHIWSRAASESPGIRVWCEANPDAVLYGEVYGNVQSLKYGLERGRIAFIGFAATDKGKWINQRDLFASLARVGVPTVPVLHDGPFDIAAIKALAENDSTVAVVSGHMMEGVVIVPAEERFDTNLGKRVALKLISNRYWEGND